VGSTRFVLIVSLVAVLGAVSLLPSTRPAVRGVLQETKWWMRGVHPDAYYRQAEVFYQMADFERSRWTCLDALRLDPDHPPAKALLTEIEFILGIGKATPATEEYDRYMR